MRRDPAERMPDMTLPQGPERLLMFDISSRRYALRETSVAGLIECGHVRPVPGAPAAVVGLTDWRGHVMTLIDLHRVLDDTPERGPSCIVRLAAPLERAALRVHSTLRLVEMRVAAIDAAGAECATPGVESRFEHDDRMVSLLDPQAIILHVAAQSGVHC